MLTLLPSVCVSKRRTSEQCASVDDPSLERGVKMKIGRLVVVMGMLAGASIAHADPSHSGRVTSLVVTYMPYEVGFFLDTGMPSSCTSSGGLFRWGEKNGKTVENVKAVYAGLLAAYLSGKPVTVAYSATDSVCNGTYIQVN